MRYTVELTLNVDSPLEPDAFNIELDSWFCATFDLSEDIKDWKTNYWTARVKLDE